MSTRKFYVCPLCSRDWKHEPPALVQRVGTFLREVCFGGRGKIALLRSYQAKDVHPSGTWVTEVRAAVLKLATLMGFELTGEMVRGVVREYTVQKGRQRIRKVEEQARHWARQRRNAGKQRGRVARTAGAVDGGKVLERWHPDEFTTGGAVDAGKVQESW